MYYGYGASREGCLVDSGEEIGVLERSGNWFSFKGERIGQGRENAMATLKSQPKMADELEAAIRAKAFSGDKPAEERKAPASKASAAKRN